MVSLRGTRDTVANWEGRVRQGFDGTWLYVRSSKFVFVLIFWSLYQDCVHGDDFLCGGLWRQVPWLKKVATKLFESKHT